MRIYVYEAIGEAMQRRAAESVIRAWVYIAFGRFDAAAGACGKAATWFKRAAKTPHRSLFG